MAAPQPVLVFPEARPAEVLAARYSHVRRVSLDDLRAAARRRISSCRACRTRARRSGISRTRAGSSSSSCSSRCCRGYRAFHPRLRVPVQFLLPDRRADARASAARTAHAPDRRARCCSIARTSTSTCRSCSDARRDDDTAARRLTTLGLNHEQQHQELMLTDIKHLLLAQSAAARVPQRGADESNDAAAPLHFISFDGGIREIGASGKHFCFDNETAASSHARRAVCARGSARHERRVSRVHSRRRLSAPGVLALGRLEHGHARRLDCARSTGRRRSMREFTLHGLQPLDPAAPVCHISLLRSGRVRALGGRAPAERSGMGARRGIVAGRRQPARTAARCIRTAPRRSSRA